MSPVDQSRNHVGRAAAVALVGVLVLGLAVCAGRRALTPNTGRQARPLTRLGDQTFQGGKHRAPAPRRSTDRGPIFYGDVSGRKDRDIILQHIGDDPETGLVRLPGRPDRQGPRLHLAVAARRGAVPGQVRQGPHRTGRRRGPPPVPGHGRRRLPRRRTSTPTPPRAPPDRRPTPRPPRRRELSPMQRITCTAVGTARGARPRGPRRPGARRGPGPGGGRRGRRELRRRPVRGRAPTRSRCRRPSRPAASWPAPSPRSGRASTARRRRPGAVVAGPGRLRRATSCVPAAGPHAGARRPSTCPRPPRWRSSYCTAWFALTRRTTIAPGETVLVLGAGGGVGLAAIDVARPLGAAGHRRRVDRRQARRRHRHGRRGRPSPTRPRT